MKYYYYKICERRLKMDNKQRPNTTDYSKNSKNDNNSNFKPNYKDPKFEDIRNQNLNNKNIPDN